MASGRIKGTCTECRRRKQKCSGSWPCRHCTDRRVIPRCHFRLDEIDTRLTEATKPPKRNWRSRRSYEGPNESDFDHKAVVDVKSLGYAHNPAHLDFAPSPASDGSNSHAHNVYGVASGYESHLQQALRALPPRSLTDYLVEYYLLHLNATYCVIHYESFTETYAKFCSDRVARRSISPSFVSLLLQICANTLQEADGLVKEKAEFELGESAHGASIRLCQSADAISRTISPGCGGLHQSLQLLESATWLKGEGRIVEAWHSLARAVREEQECNMQESENASHLSDMDRELRSRVWCYTMLWDWQMAHWLDRPMLMDISENCLHSPNLEIDRLPSGAPSPFTNVFVQYKLLHAVRARFGRFRPDADPETVQQILDTIVEWTSELPSELMWAGPNIQWDAECPRIRVQRLQLHTFVEMVRLTTLKQYLIHPERQHSPHTNLRQSAMCCAIDCIHAAVEYLTVIEQLRTRFHFVTFALFDTVTSILSAVLHSNREHDMPFAGELMDASFLALRALQNIARSTVFAQNATKVLKSLVSKLPPRWKDKLRTCGFESEEELESHLQRAPSAETSAEATSTTPEVESGSQSLSTIPDATLTPPSELFPESFGDFDLDGVEQIWDWEALDFGLVNTDTM